MKKIYFAAFALLSLLLTTSCSNDDIEVATVGRIHKVSVNINTKGIYEKFGIDDNVFDNYLHSNSRNIGVKTLVYNEEGNLVGEKESYEQAYNNIIHSFELEEGKHYTIITLEFLVNPDNDYKSEIWDVLDTQKMSTLKIKQKEDYNKATSILDVIGVNTTAQLIVKDESLNITPEAIGSKVKFFPYNFKNAYDMDGNGYLKKITELCLGTYSKLDYYSLNPSLNDKERFVKKLTAEKVFSTIADFDLSSGKIDGYYTTGYVVNSEVDFLYYLHYEGQEEGTFTRYTVNDINSSLENGKTYYAGFCYIDPYSYPESSLFDSYEALKIWVNKVIPTKGLYKEPYTTWGASVSTVKNYMSAYSLGGNLTTNGKYCLWYYGKNKEDEIDYYFESPTGGLEYVLVFLDPSVVGEDELQMYLYDMGYTYVGSGNGFTVYKKDANTYIEIGLNENNYWYAFYYNPASLTKEYNFPNKVRAFAPKRDVSGQPSKVTINKDAVKSKLLQAERAFSMKEAK